MARQAGAPLVNNEGSAGARMQSIQQLQVLFKMAFDFDQRLIHILHH